jgi:hypothetical protein
MTTNRGFQRETDETEANRPRERRAGFLWLWLAAGFFAAFWVVGQYNAPPLSVSLALAGDRADLPGTEEFGLSKRELVQKIEAVEALIADCMAEAGFEYIAASYRTVRRGMTADKSLPGMGEKRFMAEHGFGIATLYTGKPPQLVEGYSPARIGLGEQNIRIFQNLSPADQVAYNHTLFGENTEVSFAVGLEIEDFSRCGGCTRKAIAQVFTPEQLQSTYYNPKDALVNKDPRMVATLKKISEAYRREGFDYDHPDDVEPDIRRRLYEITGGGTVPLEKLSPEALEALRELQAYERAVAVLTYELESRVFDPVEDRVERELYARPPE